jgi:Dynein heavy chain C-terminal domain
MHVYTLLTLLLLHDASRYACVATHCANNRYSTLVGVMRRTLSELQKALSGLVVLSSELEAMASSLYDQQVQYIHYVHTMITNKCCFKLR